MDLRLSLGPYLVVAFCWSSSLSAAQQTVPQPTAHSPSRASALAERQVLAVLDDIKAGRPVDESAATKMLIDASQFASDSTVQLAHALFGMTVWSSKAVQAQNERDAIGTGMETEQVLARERVDQALAAWWARTDGTLAQGGLPPTFVAAGQAHLAQYYGSTARRSECQKCLDAYEPALADPKVLSSFHGLYWTVKGLLADHERNLALALDCHTRALAARKQAGMIPDIAQGHGNLGLVHLRLGDYSAATAELEAAVKLYRQVTNPNSLDVVHVLVNLAKARESQRDYGASIEQYEEARRLLPNIASPRQRGNADILLRNNLALARYLQGDFARAEREFVACHEALRAAAGEHDERLAEIDVNLGWVALTMGRQPEARKRFEQALQFLQKHRPDYHRVPEIAAYLARAELACGERDKARVRLTSALTHRHQQLHSVLQTALSQRDRLAYFQQLRVHPEAIAWPGVFDTWLELSNALGISQEEQYEKVLSWKGALARYRGADPAEAERETIRREIFAERAKHSAADPDVVARIAQLERRANALERSMRQSRQAVQPQPPIAPAAVAAALPQGAVQIDVLETRRYRPRETGEPVADDRIYLAFVVQSDGTIRRIDLGMSEEIDPAVELLNQRIADKRPSDDQRTALGDLIGTPLRQAADSAASLIISGDGWLNRVPWCALPGVAKKYWVEEITVSTVPTVQSLVARRARQPAAGDPSWLLVGGVDYGETQASPEVKPRFVPLPRTADEARQIHRLLTARFQPEQIPRLLTGSLAKRETVVTILKQRPGPRIVHLATHGEFPRAQADASDPFAVLDATKGLDSALAFAGANGEGGAGALLTADEVGSLDLGHIDLIVLAACKTGLGHITAGQGQVGLLGALDRAQVGTVVASLWPVDDDATGQLMTRFYTRHFAKEAPLPAAEALRQAQLVLLSDPGRADPYFWAAWTLMGEPRGYLPQR